MWAVTDDGKALLGTDGGGTRVTQERPIANYPPVEGAATPLRGALEGDIIASWSTVDNLLSLNHLA